MRAIQIPSTIARLKASGYKVNIYHYRPARDGQLGVKTVEFYPTYVLRDQRIEPAPHGGRTEVIIKNSEDIEVFRGEALCSKRDNFWGKVGTAIALGRAVKKLNERETWS